MDRKTISGLALCFLFYIGYETYLNKKYPDRYKRPSSSTPTDLAPQQRNTSSARLEQSNTAPQMESQRVREDIPVLSQEELTIDNRDISVVFNQDLGAIQSITLKKYQNDAQTEQMQILNNPLVIQGTSQLNKLHNQRMIAEREGQTVRFIAKSDNWRITHSYSFFEEGYGADISINWENIGSTSLDLTSYVVMSENINFPKKSTGFLPGIPTGKPSIVTDLAGKSQWHDIQDYCEGNDDVIKDKLQDVDFIGFDHHYFAKTLLPQSKKSSFLVLKSDVLPGHSCKISNWISLEQGSVAPGNHISMSYKAWFGPKSTDLMEAYDPKLKESLDLGFFSVLSKPLFFIMKEIHDLLGNWGIAVIILTLLIKIIFYPLTKQAAIAQNRMKKLQPEMNKIKEKYKDDPRRMQQETMRFMGAHKVNPMKGCLPILPQMPVFFAFYRLLSTSIELRQAPFFGWISDLSVSDPYYITPLLLGVTMFMQQKLVPTTGLDKTQERIMMMLPLFFTVMMLTLPAGMVLYMLTNTIVSILQQQWLNKKIANQ